MNMLNDDHIQNEINKTLQSLEGIERAEANPFLFTRLKARMQPQKNFPGKIISFICRPVIAIAILILVMAVNAWSVFNSDTTDNLSSENDKIAISDITNDYDVLASADNYDYENLITK